MAKRTLTSDNASRIFEAVLKTIGLAAIASLALVASVRSGSGEDSRYRVPPALEKSVPGDRDAVVPDDLYQETYRPQFHFTPVKNWMNDPNGPIYYQGEYHLFYQYNPFGIEWGHMSWGHAVSRDLVHWQHLPLALGEENGVMIFSGSTVVDWRNSSGFCHNPDAKDLSCLVAIYTGDSPKLETQNIAYSNDKGRTWTKYSENPVIDLHLSNFRDPKVFWHEATHKWVMVTVLAKQHKVRFFGSTDLKHWTALSDFGPAGATGGVWECPDLFPVPIENEAGQSRWVLSINLSPGGVARGPGNQYFIGQFDGANFSNDGPADQTLWADNGQDFYASTSFADLPPSDGRRIWLGWLYNWGYAAKVPTYPWRGSHSIPRELRLRHFGEGLRLVQRPVRELQILRQKHMRLHNRSIDAANRLLKSQAVRGKTLEIEVEIDSGGASEVGLKVRKGPVEETVVGVDIQQLRLFVDRTRSGVVAFDAGFSGRQTGLILLDRGQSVKLHIFVDWSSVEVFANQGETVISDTIFPKPDSDGLELYSHGGQARVRRLDVWNLRSVYP